MLRTGHLVVLVALVASAAIGYFARPVAAPRVDVASLTPALDDGPRASRAAEGGRIVDQDLVAAPRATPPRHAAEPAAPRPVSPAARVVPGADLRLTGRVLDTSGAPLANVLVMTDGRERAALDLEGLARSTEDAGRAQGPRPELEAVLAESLTRNERELRESWARARRATSDGAGRFALDVERPGEYYVRAHADGYEFRPMRASTGRECELLGVRVVEFELDLRLPNGAQPERAVLATQQRGTSGPGLAWSPEAPTVRVTSPRLRFVALAGDVRRLDTYGQFGSDFASGVVALNFAVDGRGPHRITLAPRATLTVTLSGGGPELGFEGAHVWAVPAEPTPTTPTQDRPANSVPLTPADECFVAYDLAPGQWIVRAGWTYNAALVERTVPVDGPVAVTLALPALGGEEQLQVSVRGPDGRLLPDVRFVARWSGARGGGGGGLSAARARDGTYWIPWRALAKAAPNDAETEVHLGAQHQDFGTAVTALGQHPTRVELRFAAPCLVVANVEGALDGDLSVDAQLVVPGLSEPWPWSMQQGAEPVDSRGLAYLPPLQPGRYALTLNAPVDPVRQPHNKRPVQELEVDLRGGAQTVHFDAPRFHDVTVNAPDLPIGSRLTLQRTSASGRQSGWSYEGAVDEGQRVVLTRVLAGDYTLRGPRGGQESMPVRVPSGAIIYQPPEQADRR